MEEQKAQRKKGDENCLHTGEKCKEIRNPKKEKEKPEEKLTEEL